MNDIFQPSMYWSMSCSVSGQILSELGSLGRLPVACLASPTAVRRLPGRLTTSGPGARVLGVPQAECGVSHSFFPSSTSSSRSRFPKLAPPSQLASARILLVLVRDESRRRIAGRRMELHCEGCMRVPVLGRTGSTDAPLHSTDIAGSKSKSLSSRPSRS